jgi:DNA-binding NarL/FixJ family response regulator
MSRRALARLCCWGQATLVLSNHTVKSHINRIFAKTRSRDRAAATQYAQTHNLH